VLTKAAHVILLSMSMLQWRASRTMQLHPPTVNTYTISFWDGSNRQVLLNGSVC